MTDETVGAAAPATEQAVIAPAASEQANPKIESIQNPNAEAAPERPETKANEETPIPEGQEDPDKPKPLSRQQRLQRKAARLSTIVAEQAAELEKLRNASKSGSDAAPKEEDFNGDYFAYQRAATAWEVKQELRNEFRSVREQEQAKTLAERRAESEEDFRERVSAIKPSIPDYDTAIQAFVKAGGDLAPHVIEEIQESEKGPVLAYHLAKNPDLAAELNAMSPRDAAREIGRLEAKVSLPQPKKQTQAPAPLSVLKGGAAPATDLASLAKSDDASAYIAARRAQQKARA